MTTEVSISESSISEESSSTFTPTPGTLFLERRPVMIYGTAAYRAEMGNDFAGVQIVTLLERTGWAVQPDGRGGIENDPSTIKILREIWPLLRGTPGDTINIYAGTQATTPEDVISWVGPFPFVLGQDSSVQPLVEGPFLAVRLTSMGQHPWSLLMLDLDIDKVGEVFTL